MGLDLKNNKKSNQYFRLIFIIYLLTIVLWLYVFEIKKTFDIEDVFFEGMYLLAVLVSLLFIKRLNLLVLNIGWGLFTWGLIIDFLDEFTKEPEFFDTILEGIITITGLLIIAYGFYIHYFQQKRIEKKLSYLADHDSITGSYNRHYFTRTAKQEIDRSRRYGHTIGFMMLDIDRFKEINDRFGHQQGDRILKKVALFLKNQLRTVDKVIRYGGDEFLIVLPESREELESVKERLIRQLKKLNIDEIMTGFPLSLSIGTALWKPDKTESLEDILSLADRRMYQEKRKKTVNQEKKK
jgi:diguanylate cyclase (GGDEF)-like protein